MESIHEYPSVSLLLISASWLIFPYIQVLFYGLFLFFIFFYFLFLLSYCSLCSIWMNLFHVASSLITSYLGSESCLISVVLCAHNWILTQFKSSSLKWFDFDT